MCICLCVYMFICLFICLCLYLYTHTWDIFTWSEKKYTWIYLHINVQVTHIKLLFFYCQVKTIIYACNIHVGLYVYNFFHVKQKWHTRKMCLFCPEICGPSGPSQNGTPFMKQRSIYSSPWWVLQLCPSDRLPSPLLPRTCSHQDPLFNPQNLQGILCCWLLLSQCSSALPHDSPLVSLQWHSALLFSTLFVSDLNQSPIFKCHSYHTCGMICALNLTTIICALFPAQIPPPMILGPHIQMNRHFQNNILKAKLTKLIFFTRNLLLLYSLSHFVATLSTQMAKPGTKWPPSFLTFVTSCPLHLTSNWILLSMFP